ncbi:hypothetical protein [Streptomyces mobaraensis]|uniref:hypothetical protein n=1 Tax=Streptomyces mobaraensis TaxID=35621 RepID=UPI001F03F6A0|nr:hypothetical protein [Streptomyces mobaraensis]
MVQPHDGGGQGCEGALGFGEHARVGLHHVDLGERGVQGERDLASAGAQVEENRSADVAQRAGQEVGGFVGDARAEGAVVAGGAFERAHAVLLVWGGTADDEAELVQVSERSYEQNTAEVRLRERTVDSGE